MEAATKTAMDLKLEMRTGGSIEPTTADGAVARNPWSYSWVAGYLRSARMGSHGGGVGAPRLRLDVLNAPRVFPDSGVTWFRP